MAEAGARQPRVQADDVCAWPQDISQYLSPKTQPACRPARKPIKVHDWRRIFLRGLPNFPSILFDIPIAQIALDWEAKVTQCTRVIGIP
jgi:hypothetical protein